MPDLKIDSEVHEGTHGSVYRDFRSLEDALDYIADLPPRSAEYLSAYGTLNPDSGSDEEGTEKAWRGISQLARPSWYARSYNEELVTAELHRLFDRVEVVRVNARNI